ncbi:flagellar biosynthesis protein FlhF [Noviherbaspirillum galbum]|uniref:Uncharacterized protein n=1 Tax=Noviherbaspirillum galbum TaxID=2709383 RepID=A0A6B3SHJ9_9BURK|nr:hypothetical protein [Noviherbaspirillum galbum]NEX60133.1 hypothetical protein [Noviherbaspirillum galbum]
MAAGVDLNDMKWQERLMRTFSTEFKKDPLVHTFIVSAPSRQLTKLLHEAIHCFVKATGHPAGDPSFQVEVASRGMNKLVKEIVGASGNSDLTAKVAPALADESLAAVASPAASLPAEPDVPLRGAAIQTGGQALRAVPTNQPIEPNERRLPAVPASVSPGSTMDIHESAMINQADAPSIVESSLEVTPQPVSAVPAADAPPPEKPRQNRMLATMLGLSKPSTPVSSRTGFGG